MAATEPRAAVTTALLAISYIILALWAMTIVITISRAFR
jgi:hypothetical protein